MNTHIPPLDRFSQPLWNENTQNPPPPLGVDPDEYDPTDEFEDEMRDAVETAIETAESV